MSIVIVAEKPSVARDIAEVVGANTRARGRIHGNGHVVTWAIGHLVGLAQPHEVDPSWKAWRAETLPMLPKAWPLSVLDETKDQFTVVKKLINARETEQVICATDAGREGELIFRLIYEAAGCRKPVRRLWISSLTPSAISAGLASMKDDRHYDPLAFAARGRSQADWLVGMNLSRAYSIAHGDKRSVGRVQTPTLAMLVEREKEIRAFVPAGYFEVVATFGEAPYRGTWFRSRTQPLGEAKRLPADGAEAGAIVERVEGAGIGVIESVTEERRRMPAPLLYDLTELQRHANRLFGFSAKRTLDVAQSLYESKKLISYPRTDSRHLSTDIAATLSSVVRVIRPGYESMIADGTGVRPLGRRFVDDANVSDHHAIIPTTSDPQRVSLNNDERRLYDLICRRLLSAWHEDHIWAVTTVITAVTGKPPDAGPTPIIDRFHTAGSAVVQVGWKVLDPPSKKKDGEAEEHKLPSGLSRGATQRVREVKAERKKTRPPKRFTDATLLTAMETAGKTLDDRELSRAMKDCGLGTPATRAATIETLLAREYIVREGKMLLAADKGIGLIDAVHPDVKSPAMTGQWEARLRAIERGEADLSPFMTGIENYVTEVVAMVLGGPRSPKGMALAVASVGDASGVPGVSDQSTAGVTAPPALNRPPRSRDLNELLTKTFGHTGFRPHQEAVCKAARDGEDVLLVMPTGAGKSLCYQLPGLARGGTTLVVSPLIALMEDQVAKLQALGLRAERIHSGRDRVESRAVCVDYLAGALDFLFIAPERLAVSGFPEFLARTKPSLIAIDEAHCISQWGHDFRPEYRMLGQRLPSLRPAPVIALTATATPTVQGDIAAQLGLQSNKRFIHGFRRSNLAIEVVEVPRPGRMDVVQKLLSELTNRPAIVYAPSRKDTEALAGQLAAVMPAAAYHAGMPIAERDRVQARFLAGDVEVIVATVAFGMGIDKPDVRTVVHLALPQTLEGYYQEIGRAGRDGKPSRAVLLHSFVDRKTNEYFHEKNYPPADELAAIFEHLTPDRQDKIAVMSRVKMDEEMFNRALEKLWVHGGALVDADEALRSGEASWRPSYEAQLKHRLEQSEQMARFAQSHGCRMVHLIQHFGDREDAGTPCGLCDVCAAGACAVQAFRPPQREEAAIMLAVLDALGRFDRQSVGMLHRNEGATIERHDFETLVSALVRGHLATISPDVFEKDGKSIPFHRLSLTLEGRRAEGEAIAQLRLPVALTGGRKQKKPGGKRRSKRKVARSASSASGGTRGDMRTQRLGTALRAWRKKEAERRHVPAFRIFTDKVLHGIVASRPRSESALLAISGIGPAFVEKAGTRILELVRESGRGV